MALDVNGDGSLSMDELEKGLSKQKNGKKILDLLRAADTDGSGDINYTEFIAATLDKNIFMNETYLKQAFDMFDKDGNGTIDNEEVLALLTGEGGLNSIIPKESIQKAIAEIDVNGDGEIDFQEFVQMMKKASANV